MVFFVSGEIFHMQKITHMNTNINFIEEGIYLLQIVFLKWIRSTILRSRPRSFVDDDRTEEQNWFFPRIIFLRFLYVYIHRDWDLDLNYYCRKL